MARPGAPSPGAYVALVLGSLAVGAAAVFVPWWAAAVVAALLVLTLALRRWGFQAHTVFLVCLGVLLLGYAFAGKGFAYVRVGPVFIGEVVAAVGVATVIVVGLPRRTFRSPIVWLLVLFMGWSALCTLPYLNEYGRSALRDAALWGYGLFTLLVAGHLQRDEGRPLLRALDGYGRVMPWLLLWIPASLLLWELAADAVPTWPGTLPPVEVVFVKTGDMAVHLAGCVAFLTGGLYALHRSDEGFLGETRQWVLWALVVAGFLLTASLNRGALLAVIGGAGLAFVLRPSSRMVRAGLIAVVIGSVFLLVGTEVDLGGARKISPQQITANIESIFGGSPRPGLAGTRGWRLEWWGEILDYTVFGPRFWTGKGYGVNLAWADGFQVSELGALRSPHNGHMTVLARSGVPGLVLWIALHATFAVTMLRGLLLARRQAAFEWAAVYIWVLAYWAAFLVNGSFDVYLEGPQGGIWFWSVMGLGIAAWQLHRAATRRAAGEGGTSGPGGEVWGDEAAIRLARAYEEEAPQLAPWVRDADDGPPAGRRRSARSA